MPHHPRCPDPASWEIGTIAPEQDRIGLSLEPRRTTVACPICGTHRRRIPSHSRRRPWYVPWAQWPVPLVVHARRFFCDAPGGPQRLFVKPLLEVLAR
jgi:hypothetical protein